LSPEIDKIDPRSVDLMIFWPPEIDKIDPRSVDLMTFWLWFQNSTNSIPEVLI
jgi:hypothetical protein